MHTIKEVAALLGISRQAVLKQVQKGKIKADKVGATYIISAKEYKALSKTITT
jgi:excisionase family DNA binding protein